MPLPFQDQSEISPGKNAFLHCTTARFTPLSFGHESFPICCPAALRCSASYLVLVHRLTIYAPRFLPTLGHPRAVAFHFVRYDQLTVGLAPTGMRPCWAHNKKDHLVVLFNLLRIPIMRTNDTLPVFNISSRESSHLDFEEQGLAARACAGISTGLGGAIAGAILVLYWRKTDRTNFW